MQQKIEQNKESIVFGNDSIAVRKCLADIQGGRTLDVGGYTEDVIKVLHVIIKKSDGSYAPMPVSGKAYASLPEGAVYVGLLKDTILTKKPAAAILTYGTVNETLVPYPMSGIMAAFKAACPHITFEKDEEA